MYLFLFQVEYLLKWTNFCSKFNSWQKEEYLKCPDLIEDYENESYLKGKAKGKQRKRKKKVVKGKPAQKKRNPTKKTMNLSRLCRIQ